ncbi:MAG: C25 family cysteine peptidase [Proteobacteria bacterium]|nr:C25 family cysteine peptidase [Pseudomonadota bacterium]
MMMTIGQSVLLGLILLSARASFAKVNFSELKNKRGPSSIEVTLDTSDGSVSIQNGADAFVKKASDLTIQAKDGYPEVYSTGRLIVAPKGYMPRLVIERETTRSIENTLLRPYTQKFRCSRDESQTKNFGKRSLIYQSSSLYPGSSISLEPVGQIQDADVFRITLNPMRQDFKGQYVMLTEQLKARVEFDLVDSKAATKSFNMSGNIAQMVSAATINGRSVLSDSKSNFGNESMLLVYHEDYTDVVKPLIAWKVQRGIKVIARRASEMGATKEAIAAKIKDIYNQEATKPTYLLFVGNAKQIPTFSQPTGSGNAASDYPYSLLTAGDALPDLLIGRLVGDNVSEIATYVRKSLETEMNSDLEASWYQSSTTVASNEGSGPSDAEYAQMVEKSQRDAGYLSVDQFYQGSGNATPANISNALNSGRSWITYFGHGSGTSWGSTNGSFGIAEIEKLSNANRLPVLIDVACLNGAFASTKPCFGKAWMTKKVDGLPAGLSAYYGGSVSVSWDPPAVMAVGSAKYHFEKSAFTIGETTLAGQLHLIEQMGLGPDIIDNLEWYNLFGDPSMIMRTGKQTAISVETTIDGETVTVLVKSSTGSVKPGQIVTISDSGSSTPLAVSITDENGTAALRLSGKKRQKGRTLTVLGYNSQTVQNEL